MIKRQTVAAILTTTAIAFSICPPARAASLAGGMAERSAPQADRRNGQAPDARATRAEARAPAEQ